jgi:hypothetical protein
VTRVTRQGVRQLDPPNKNGHRYGKPKLHGVCDHDWVTRIDDDYYFQEYTMCRKCGVSQ